MALDRTRGKVSMMVSPITFDSIPGQDQREWRACRQDGKCTPIKVRVRVGGRVRVRVRARDPEDGRSSNPNLVIRIL